MYKAMLSLRQISRAGLFFCLLSAIAGCGNGGGMAIVGISPASTQFVPVTVDSGQMLPITASVVNDVNGSGATFTFSGGGSLGTPVVTRSSDATSIAVGFTPPVVTVATTVKVTATSVRTPASSATVYITVNPAIVIAPATLPAGVVGTAYSATIAASGGTAPVSLSLLSGTLPPGLTANFTAGTISGKPTTFGTYTFTVGATDKSYVASTFSQTYTVVIAPMLPTVTTTALANALVSVAYNQQLAYAGGGTGAPAWTLVSGALPTGLSLSSTGLISGTAAVGSTSSTFSVAVAIGTQTSVAATLSIAVTPLPAITTTALPSGNVGFAYSQQLSYTGGGSGTPVWSVTSGGLPAGLTLTSGGLLSGTPTTQATSTFGVAVTVGSQTSSAQSYTLPIYGLVITSATTASGEVALPFSFALAARGGTPPYTWSLATGSPALPAGLTLNAAGSITGTPTTSVGSPFSIAVKATDSAASAGTATATLTVNIAAARTGANNSELSGQYAFLLSGFDADGNPLAKAGKFIADGNGNITGGAMDTNGTGASTLVTNATLSTSAYAVGADGRGKVTLTSAAGSSTFTLSLNQIAGGVAGGGYLTEFDATGQRLTGVFSLQSAAAFNTVSIVNGFAFGAEGFAPASTGAPLQHRAVVGEIQFTGSGGTTGAEYLTTDNGSTAPIVPTSTTIAIAANGRGTLSLISSAGTMNFVAYVVSSGKLYLLSSDAAAGGGRDLLYGQALQQTTANGSFASASLKGIAVMHAQRLGVTTAGVAFPDVQVGLYTFGGSGTATLASDENAGGTITTNALTGSYMVAANGRAALNLGAGFGGCTDCAGTQTYAYLVGANQGFLLDFSTPVLSGYFEPQTATGITGSSLSGTYASGSLSSLATGVVEDSAAFSANGTGALTGTEDQSAAGTLSPGVAIAASYTAAATGRFAVSPIGSGNAVLYLISPAKALLVDLSSGAPVVQELTH